MTTPRHRTAAADVHEFHESLVWELGRIVESTAGVREELIHVRPAAVGANSLAGIATHALGAACQHVLGWALKRDQPDEVDRFDDDASSSDIRALASSVFQQLDIAFDELSGIPLDTPVMTAGQGEQPIRAVLMWAVLHAAEHVGAAELTSGLVRERPP